MTTETLREKAERYIVTECVSRGEWCDLVRELLGMETALQDMFDLLDSHWLVRDTSGDSQPGWALKQVEPLRKLAAARQRLPQPRHEEGVCVFPVGMTTCGYTRHNHHKADGSPMDHDFMPLPDGSK